MTVGYRRVAPAIVIFLMSMMLWHSAFAQDLEADAKVTACSNPITSCGCTITKPGLYEIPAPLLSSQGLTALGDCIDIRASRVVLEAVETMNSTSTTMSVLIGPGGEAPTGIGIHILKGSNYDFVEMSAAFGWDVGVMVEGNNNTIQSFFSMGNATAGLELNNAKNNTIADLFAFQNLNYGLWIRQSTNNQVSFSVFENNTKVGLYVGCSDSASFSEQCNGVRASNGNQIYEVSTNSNNYGIVIDSGNAKNIVTNNFSSGNSTDDQFDANNNCDDNRWLLNRFSSSNLSCIQ